MADVIQILQDALELDRRGEVAAARERLAAIEGRLPDEAAYQKLVGLMYQRLGDNAASIGYLARAAALDPDDAETQIGLGHHWTESARQADAADAYGRAAEIAPDDPEPHLQRGRCLGYLGEFDAAEGELRDAVRLAPGRIEPLLHLGNLLNEAGRGADAAESFAAALVIEPTSVLAEVGLRRARFLAEDGLASDRGGDAPAATVVCVKHGAKYSAEYVNKLHAMVARNTAAMPRFVCLTEDATGLAAGVEARPLPADGLQGWWNKVALFKRDIGLEGRLLYLDLDVVIVGALDPLLRYDSAFAVMDNEYVPGFNSSVFLFEAGASAHIWDDFTPAHAERLAGDQDWLSLQMPGADLWPRGWCVPYRLRAVDAPPADARVVVFSGLPNPEDYPSPWIREAWTL